MENKEIKDAVSKIKFLIAKDVSDIIYAEDENGKRAEDVILLGLDETAKPIYIANDKIHFLKGQCNEDFVDKLCLNIFGDYCKEERQIIKEGGKILNHFETWFIYEDKKGRRYQYNKGWGLFSSKRILKKGDVVKQTKNFITRYGNKEFYGIYFKDNEEEILITSANCRHQAIAKTKLLERIYKKGYLDGAADNR